MTEAPTSTQKIEVKGGHLADKVRELLHEGNVRRIIIRDPRGKSVAEVPATVGVLGVLAAPTMVAIGTVAALTADYSIEVERELPDPPAPDTTSPADNDKERTDG